MDELMHNLGILVSALSLLLFAGPILALAGLIDKAEIGALKINMTRTSRRKRSAVALLGLASWLLLYFPLVYLAFRAVESAPSDAVQVERALPPAAGEPVFAVRLGEDVFQVSSTLGWQDTGMHFEAGDRLEILALDGSWNRWPGHESETGGEGNPDYVCALTMPARRCVEPLPGSPSGALIARVGDLVFEVGAGITVRVRQSGALALRINDGDSGLYDNQGALLVKVFRR
jgi:hypothetical protein